MNSIYQPCNICKKKVMISGKCKCQNFYCDKHKLNHPCSFEHFKHNKEMLERSNPKIEGAKIVKL